MTAVSATALQQSILLLVSVGLALIVRRSARTGRLSFSTAVMWAGLALIGLAGAALIPFVSTIGAALGLLPAAILAGAASVLLAAIAFSLSVRVSSLETGRQDLAESLGRMSLDPPLPPSRGPDDVVALVPAFNESRSVGVVVGHLRSAGFPVLVIDDGSSDGTTSVARAAGASVLPLPFNLGVGAALRAGLRTAVEHGYAQVVQCDADGQHPVEAILHLQEEQRRDPTDLLIGSRFLVPGERRKTGLVRSVATSALAWVASRAARTPITDATSGLRLIREPLLTELARSMPPHYLGDTFEANIMAGRAGFVIREAAVPALARWYGSSSASPAAAFRLTIRALLVALLRTHRSLEIRR